MRSREHIEEVLRLRESGEDWNYGRCGKRLAGWMAGYFVFGSFGWMAGHFALGSFGSIFGFFSFWFSGLKLVVCLLLCVQRLKRPKPGALRKHITHKQMAV